MRGMLQKDFLEDILPLGKATLHLSISTCSLYTVQHTGNRNNDYCVYYTTAAQTMDAVVPIPINTVSNTDIVSVRLATSYQVTR